MFGDRSIRSGSRFRDFAHSAADTPAGPAPTMTSSASTTNRSAAAGEETRPARLGELAAHDARLDDPRAPDAAHLEAHVPRSQHDRHAARREHPLEMVGDLESESLLELRSARVVMQQPSR